MKTIKVINLFGGPGVGKSTLSAQLFALMKATGWNVELVTEYAKDMVYEGRSNILADQLYILAKQNRRLSRLAENGVEWAVTDGPILNWNIYAGPNAHPELLNMVRHCHQQYINYNVLLMRNKNHIYQPEGRVQKTIEEAVALDNIIERLLKLYNFEYMDYEVGWDSPYTLLEQIKRKDELERK